MYILCLAEISCPPLTDVGPAITDSTNTTFGSVVTIDCLPGHYMGRDSRVTIECVQHGNWSLVVDRCERKWHGSHHQCLHHFHCHHHHPHCRHQSIDMTITEITVVAVYLILSQVINRYHGKFVSSSPPPPSLPLSISCRIHTRDSTFI